MKFFFACLGLLVFFSTTSCKSRHPEDTFRVYTRPRPDQERWINELTTSALISGWLKRYKLATQQEIVTNEIAEALRSNYTRISMDGQDVDGGTRALTFMAEYIDAVGGEEKMWHDAVVKAKKRDPKAEGAFSAPIPQDFPESFPKPIYIDKHQDLP